MAKISLRGNFAIASAVVPNQGSIGVVRLSGNQALQIAQTIFSPQGKCNWESHRILYGMFNIAVKDTM